LQNAKKKHLGAFFSLDHFVVPTVDDMEGRKEKVGWEEDGESRRLREQREYKSQLPLGTQRRRFCASSPRDASGNAKNTG